MARRHARARRVDALAGAEGERRAEAHVRGDGAAGARRVALELLGGDGRHSFRAVDGAVVEDLVHVERLADEAKGVPAAQLEVLAREAVVRVGAGGVGRRRAVRRVEGARGAVARVVGVERAERRGVEADILREEVGPVAEAKVRERARDGLSEREDDERARRVERGAHRRQARLGGVRDRGVEGDEGFVVPKPREPRRATRERLSVVDGVDVRAYAGTKIVAARLRHCCIMTVWVLHHSIQSSRRCRREMTL